MGSRYAQLLLASVLLLGCGQKAGSVGHGPAGIYAVSPFSDNRGPSEQLIAHAALGTRQGLVPAATLDEASVMIIVEPIMGEACLTLRVVDVLERAGYSVWDMGSPCLEGIYVNLAVMVSPSELILAGRFPKAADPWESEYLESEYTRVAVARSTQTETSELRAPGREDAERLAAALLQAPHFRRLVGRLQAADSADRFVVNPIDPKYIAEQCRPLAYRSGHR